MDRYGSLLIGGAGGQGLLGSVSALLAVVDDPGGEASSRLSMAITGLLGLAVVITIATIVFWRMTRPERAASEGSMRWVAPVEGDTTPPSSTTPADAAGDPPPLVRRPTRRSGTDAVAG